MPNVWDQYLKPTNARLNLRAADKTYLRTQANVAPQADLTFSICPACAQPTLTTTVANGTQQTEAVMGGLCSICVPIRNLSPTIFDWVVRVYSGQRWLDTTRE